MILKEYIVLYEREHEISDGNRGRLHPNGLMNTASAMGEDISDLKKLISVNENVRMNTARSTDLFPMAISRDYAI
jgi:hypothetical protein